VGVGWGWGGCGVGGGGGNQIGSNALLNRYIKMIIFQIFENNFYS
jgi:hypothetical protein